jgi:tRNA-2-methylthio-N6-dimethylallyladenosine synthase
LQKTFHITTMGCQMNEYDSDFLAQTLICSGFVHTDDPKAADLILINTCTVRAKPEQKALSLLGRMLAIKRRKRGLILGIVGCLAQQQGANLMERFPQLDLVMGPRELGKIREILQRIEVDRERVVATELEARLPQPIRCPGYFSGRVTAQISVMEGCNNFCSYCVVPYVRGREVSRSPQKILFEAKNLISQGVKEITLLGQNVNSYRWERGESWNFTSLLRELNQIDGLLRLRFTTSHPKDLSDELIRCFAELDRLCPHIHLPFQAGSNRILQRMRRGYTREKYTELIEKLRTVQPSIGISSDVMVGFPGETEKDFEMTLDLMKRVKFDALFSFKYSDRRGTFAEKMAPKVDEAEKAARLSVLQGLQKQITLTKNRGLEGKVMEVLVEGHSKKGSQLTGRTGSNKIINFICKDNTIGSLVNITVKHGFLNSLLGEIVEQTNEECILPSKAANNPGSRFNGYR